MLFLLATLASVMSESGEKCYACFRIKNKTNHTTTGKELVNNLKGSKILPILLRFQRTHRF